MNFRLADFDFDFNFAHDMTIDSLHRHGDGRASPRRQSRAAELGRPTSLLH